jgi:hypothetical protein
VPRIRHTGPAPVPASGRSGTGRRAGRRIRYMIALGALVTVLLPAAGRAAAGSAPAGSQDAYSRLPAALPADVGGLAFEATGTAEFGDDVELAPTRVDRPRRLQSVRVVLFGRGCQRGHWNTGDCATTPGAAFTHPLTLNVRAVNSSRHPAAPGALLASRTESARIAYRPSADPAHCTGGNAGRWYDRRSGRCEDGIAQVVTFRFDGRTVLPQRVIWTLAFDTTHYGRRPLGERTRCFTSRGGCGYDTLGVGARAFPGAPFAGTDTDPGGVLLDSATARSYCDGGAAGTGTLRLDAPCRSGLTPLAAIRTRS